MALSISPRTLAYCTKLLQPNLFTCTNDIDNALIEFEGVLNQSNYAAVLDGLFDDPLNIELILSGKYIFKPFNHMSWYILPPGLSNSTPLTTWILESFPNQLGAFQTSLASKLLQRLSVFFLFPPTPFLHDVQRVMAENHHLVSLAPVILRSLSEMTFDEDQVSESPKLTKAKPSQKKLKQAKRLNAKRVVDAKPFEVFKKPIPDNRRDAEKTVSNIMATLKTILEVCVDSWKTAATTKSAAHSSTLKLSVIHTWQMLLRR